MTAELQGLVLVLIVYLKAEHILVHAPVCLATKLEKKKQGDNFLKVFQKDAM